MFRYEQGCCRSQPAVSLGRVAVMPCLQMRLSDMIIIAQHNIVVCKEEVILMWYTLLLYLLHAVWAKALESDALFSLL